ncbi:MAG TPA: MBL fold metallo-hydrolase [Acidimicrobiales bacterium]|nr:MBL fold metallo-hydrolase [Acidimicrobiales bacterium]
MKAEKVAAVGDIVITRVREYEHAREPEVFFEDATEVRRALDEEPWLSEWCTAGGRLRLAFQAFVLEAPGTLMLVDPCIGNDRQRFFLPQPLQTSFLEDLADSVGGLERIDVVAFTHLHFDHIGWSTHRVHDRWAPTFPWARHVIPGDEWEHWRVAVERDPETDFTRAVDESIHPLFVDELVQLVDSDHELADGIRLRSTAGHSPGHVSIDIESNGERAVITGDVLHHPVQVHEPGWQMRADLDLVRGVSARSDLVDEVVDSGALMIGTHFAGCCAGHVEADDRGRRRFRAIA